MMLATDERDRLIEVIRGFVGELETAVSHLTPAQLTTSYLDGEWTVGAALIHAYEELAQHLGHLEITADLVGG